MGVSLKKIVTLGLTIVSAIQGMSAIRRFHCVSFKDLGSKGSGFMSPGYKGLSFQCVSFWF